MEFAVLLLTPLLGSLLLAVWGVLDGDHLLLVPLVWNAPDWLVLR